MRRALSVLLVGVLLVGTVGCASTGEKYCSALRDDQRQLSEMIGSSDPGALVDGLALLRSLGDRAPDDLSDEWQTFLNAVTGLRDALKAADVTPAEFKDGVPAPVTGADRTAIVDAADALGASDVIDAAEGIEDQGRDVCKVTLGL